jgi:hypothetical protein
MKRYLKTILEQAIEGCAREDAISCKDSQLITPSVSAVAARNGLTDWRLRSKNKTST